MEANTSEYALNNLILKLNAMEDNLANTIDLSESTLMNAYRTIIPQNYMKLIPELQEQVKTELQHLNAIEDNFFIAEVDMAYKNDRELKQSAALKILNKVKQEFEKN